MQMRPNRFLNCVYAWCLERVEPEKREQWTFMLDEPLPWQVHRAPSEEQIEREGEAFMDFMNAFKQGQA